MRKRYTIIYMAAGNSRRFYQYYPDKPDSPVCTNKLLWKLEGRSLYRHGLDTLLELMEQEENVRLIVITQYLRIQEEIRELSGSLPTAVSARLYTILNPDSRDGASHTIKRGLRESLSLCPFDYLMFVAADQPRLTCKTLKQFLELGDQKNDPVVTAICRSRPGNPVMFHQSICRELLELQGDEGGRKIWKRHEMESGLVEVTEDWELEDIDSFPDTASGKCD